MTTQSSAVRISPIEVWRRGYLFLRPPPNGPKATNDNGRRVGASFLRSTMNKLRASMIAEMRAAVAKAARDV